MLKVSLYSLYRYYKNVITSKHFVNMISSVSVYNKTWLAVCLSTITNFILFIAPVYYFLFRYQFTYPKQPELKISMTFK